MNVHDQSNVLESLTPTADDKIMDLVAATGIDVSSWAIKQDGTPVANPRANPNYCYEWAFGGINEPTIALCVWHDSLGSSVQGITYEGNMRKAASRLEEVRFERGASSEIRSRAKSQAKRCDRFDQRVQIAYRKSLPIRVILLQGEKADSLGHDASKVEFRRLDDLSWWVHDYDDATGAYRLVRGIEPPSLDRALTERAEDDYVDQFSAPNLGERRERTVGAFVRSADVRRQVLIRAGGLCERCGRPGFVTASGGTYLETHHVIPLCEEGADAVWNVVGLCPEDHRRAHYAADRSEIRDQLLAHLTKVSLAPTVA